MAQLPDLTDKILAAPEAATVGVAEMADWAIAMLELGYETPNLLIVAGFSQSLSCYEALPYLASACRELHLPPLAGKAAVESYCRYLVKRLAAAIHLRPTLAELHELNQEHGGFDTRDFSLLYWAWDDLEYDATYNHYWPTATLATIEQLVIATAQSWLKLHNASTE